jgi:hypothetical protein
MRKGRADACVFVRLLLLRVLDDMNRNLSQKVYSARDHSLCSYAHGAKITNRAGEMLARSAINAV